MKPIGFYVSVPEGHEDYQGLKTLEEDYGSHFEKVHLDDLKRLLSNASQYFSQGRVTGIWNFTTEVSFNLIPFLHQVIKERLLDATN